MLCARFVKKLMSVRLTSTSYSFAANVKLCMDVMHAQLIFISTYNGNNVFLILDHPMLSGVLHLSGLMGY